MTHGFVNAQFAMSTSSVTLNLVHGEVFRGEKSTNLRVQVGIFCVFFFLNPLYWKRELALSHEQFILMIQLQSRVKVSESSEGAGEGAGLWVIFSTQSSDKTIFLFCGFLP